MPLLLTTQFILELELDIVLLQEDVGVPNILEQLT